MRTTWDRILIAGDAVAAGTETAYRAVAAAPGEAHGIRADLCETHPGGIEPGEPILRLAHLTDLHLADTQSPLRLDFAMQVGERSPGWGGAVTYTFRPHELLTAHAADSMLRTLRGLDLDLCVVTGDSTDNAQANELATFLALMNGRDVAPVSAGGVYRGPQSADWGDPWYWVPDVPGDRYQHRWGYPHVPGLVAAAAVPFRAAGAGVPWIGCLGNHDVLVGGTTAVTDELSAIAVGDRKAVRLPADLATSANWSCTCAIPCACSPAPACRSPPIPGAGCCARATSSGLISPPPAAVTPSVSALSAVAVVPAVTPSASAVSAVTPRQWCWRRGRPRNRRWRRRRRWPRWRRR